MPGFLDLARQRYSVRAYRRDPIPPETLDRLLEAARLAPSACNLQPFQILVVHTEGREAELRRIFAQHWIVQAPLLIGVIGLPGSAWTRRDGRSYMDVDAAIAMDHLILAAADEGLGTCWVGAFNPRTARELLGLPANVEPIAFTPLGYPADTPPQKRRKDLAELVRWDRW